MENRAFIGLGSNMGDRYDYLMQAIKLLDSHPKIKIVNISSVYETDPVGYTDQNLFLNMVIEAETDLSAEELLESCMKIETTLGRKREIRWGPRTLDLDILLFNNENIETENLVVPHPRMFERAFVIVPLLEICPSIPYPKKNNPLVLSLNQLPTIEGVRIWKRKSGEDVFVPIES